MSNLIDLQEVIRADWETFGTLEWATLGLSSEVGELADLIVKQRYFDKPASKEALQSEIGDCLHYLVALATLLDIDLSDAVEDNIRKVLKRYPQGWDNNPLK